MNTGESYWHQRIQSQRVRRRSLLQGAAGLGVSATVLSLLGCGGGSSSSSSTSDKQGSASKLLSPVEDTSSKATKGGILPYFSANDTPGFTVYPGLSSFIPMHNDRAYSKFVKSVFANRAKGEQPLSTVEGDLAESFEISPDGLQITMKLRPNVLFDPRPPTNGRAATIDDVNYTWDLYKSQHRSRAQLSNEANKSAPVLSLTTPDAKTMVWKLAFPSPSLLANMTYYLNAPYIYPVEARDGKFDPAKDMRGSGPWLLDKYEASGTFQYRRNPGWYLKDRPYLDGYDMPIIPEYATQTAQFRKGSIYTFNIRPDDVIQTKKEVPDIVMQQADFIFDLIGAIWFDFQTPRKSIWFDDRLRQALSMTIDRDLMINSLNNVDAFTKEGVPVDKKWNSHVPLAEAEFWLDPQSKDFGENAKYFKRDLDEATKLVKAATGKDKAESPWTVISGNDYGTAYTQQADVLQAMIQEGPFKLNRVGVDYNTYFIKYVSAAPRLTGGHQFDGAAYGRIASFPEIDSYFGNHLMPGGTFFKFEEDFPPPDDKWYSLLKAQQVEQDRKKRVELIKEWQRYAAQKMYIVPHPGQASTFTVSWPWVGNMNTFSARGGGTDVTLWLDKSKMKT